MLYLFFIYLFFFLFIYYNKCEGGCLKRAPITNTFSSINKNYDKNENKKSYNN